MIDIYAIIDDGNGDRVRSLEVIPRVNNSNVRSRGSIYALDRLTDVVETPLFGETRVIWELLSLCVPIGFCKLNTWEIAEFRHCGL
ncbi:MAG: hypothetical protein ACK56F_19055, partial [bacterium]